MTETEELAVRIGRVTAELESISNRRARLASLGGPGRLSATTRREFRQAAARVVEMLDIPEASK
jgi:hypothetical protein